MKAIINERDCYKLPLLRFDSCYIKEGYCLAGPKESAGKLADNYDETFSDDRFGEASFEKGERKMFEMALSGLLEKAGICDCDISMLVGGDLLNQIVSTSFAVRKTSVPFLGLYNACGTFVESLVVGAMLTDSCLDNVVCISGSHFSTAERQYRYPLELGVLRSPVSQWTATGAGCSLLTNKECNRPRITCATVGRVTDYGILDVNNMGAAMAPAALDTLIAHLESTHSKPTDYDLIATGDLGKLGKEILVDLADKKGIDLRLNCADCGASIYFEEQQTYMGGSGAACSALLLNGMFLNAMTERKMKKMLLIGTGALMSPTTSFQGDTIPSIAHCVQIEIN